jgi:hypothetical protein
MRGAILALLGGFGALLFSLPARACDPQTGAREQRVYLDWNHQQVGEWVVDAGEIKPVQLPNGFSLGLKIEPADAAQYLKLATKIEHVPELVKISLFDLSGAAPRLLTYTYGGSNSRQGYGAKGGADRVVQLGDPGIVLTLLKPVCSERASVASVR